MNAAMKIQQRNGNGRNGTSNLTKDVKVRKVDYEAYAKERGDEAAEAAHAMGLSSEEVAQFRKVFGTPVNRELRCS